MIDALGENASQLHVGQRVSGEGHIIGRRSRNVRAGRFHLDPVTRGVSVNPYRLALAQRVADVRNVNVLEEDLRDVMAELQIREGFDIGLEMSGGWQLEICHLRSAGQMSRFLAVARPWR